MARWEVPLQPGEPKSPAYPWQEKLLTQQSVATRTPQQSTQQSAAPASSATSAPRALAAFDFDQTLACIEVGYFNQSETMREQAFGGAQRVSMLAATLAELCSLGVRCVVVSYNSKATVDRALRAVGLAQYFTSTHGHDELAAAQPGAMLPSKSALLSQLRADAATPLCFVDDDVRNVLDVGSLPNAPCTIHVACSKRPANGGMQREHCDACLQWAGSLMAASETDPLCKDNLTVAAEESFASRLQPQLDLAQSREAAPAPAAPSPRSAPCRCFAPKRPIGPLSRRCVHCDRHENEHGR